MLNYDHERTAARLYDSKVRSLFYPKAIIAPVAIADGSAIRHSVKHPEEDIDVGAQTMSTALPFLRSDHVEYAALWNIIHDNKWFEGDAHPDVLPVPLPRLGNWFSRNHPSCAILDTERLLLAEWFDLWVKPPYPSTAIKFKEANVGCPYYGKEHRNDILLDLCRNKDSVMQLMSLNIEPLVVTGFRAQDEAASKVRTTTIAGKTVTLNKRSDKFSAYFDLFKGCCANKIRTIAIEHSVALYLQCLASCIHHKMLAYPIWQFAPIESTPKSSISIDASAYDSYHSPVIFDVFHSVIARYYPVTAKVFEFTYRCNCYASEGTVISTGCAYTSWPHWGMRSGFPFVSVINKLMAVYLLYVRTLGIPRTMMLVANPGEARNNGDDNLIPSVFASDALASISECGYVVTRESGVKFNGMEVNVRDGFEQWCSRLTSFWRRCKPEHSVGGKWNPEPWLGYLIGRNFYYNSLPSKDRHIVELERQIILDLYHIDMYKEAIKRVNYNDSLPISYIEFLRLTKPDAVFWLPDLESGLPGIDNVQQYLR